MENSVITPEQEAAGFAFMLELAHAERDGTADLATLKVGPYTAFILIGCLQFAHRGMHASPEHQAVIQGLIDQMTPLFDGTPAEPLVRAGNDPAQDVLRDPPDVEFSVAAPGPVGCPKCGAYRWHADMTPEGLLYTCMACENPLTVGEMARYITEALMGKPDLPQRRGQDDLAPGWTPIECPECGATDWSEPTPGDDNEDLTSCLGCGHTWAISALMNRADLDPEG